MSFEGTPEQYENLRLHELRRKREEAIEQIESSIATIEIELSFVKSACEKLKKGG